MDLFWNVSFKNSTWMVKLTMCSTSMKLFGSSVLLLSFLSFFITTSLYNWLGKSKRGGVSRVTLRGQSHLHVSGNCDSQSPLDWDHWGRKKKLGTAQRHKGAPASWGLLLPVPCLPLTSYTPGQHQLSVSPHRPNANRNSALSLRFLHWSTAMKNSCDGKFCHVSVKLC